MQQDQEFLPSLSLVASGFEDQWEALGVYVESRDTVPPFDDPQMKPLWDHPSTKVVINSFLQQNKIVDEVVATDTPLGLVVSYMGETRPDENRSLELNYPFPIFFFQVTRRNTLSGSLVAKAQFPKGWTCVPVGGDTRFVQYHDPNGVAVASVMICMSAHERFTSTRFYMQEKPKDGSARAVYLFNKSRSTSSGIPSNVVSTSHAAGGVPNSVTTPPKGNNDDKENDNGDERDDDDDTTHDNRPLKQSRTTPSVSPSPLQHQQDAAANYYAMHARQQAAIAAAHPQQPPTSTSSAPAPTLAQEQDGVSFHDIPEAPSNNKEMKDLGIASTSMVAASTSTSPRLEFKGAEPRKVIRGEDDGSDIMIGLDDAGVLRARALVLAPEKYEARFRFPGFVEARHYDQRAIDSLDQLLVRYPQAQLVLTSPWRCDWYNRETYNTIFGHKDCGLISSRLTGALRELSEHTFLSRQAALALWLKDHPKIKRVIMIQDGAMDPQPEISGVQVGLIQVELGSLLQEVDVWKAIRLLALMEHPPTTGEADAKGLMVLSEIQRRYIGGVLVEAPRLALKHLTRIRLFDLPWGLTYSLGPCYRRSGYPNMKVEILPPLTFQDPDVLDKPDFATAQLEITKARCDLTKFFEFPCDKIFIEPPYDKVDLAKQAAKLAKHIVITKTTCNGKTHYLLQSKYPTKSLLELSFGAWNCNAAVFLLSK